MNRAKRVFPGLPAFRLVLFFLAVLLSSATPGLELSSAVASDEPAISATPLGPDPAATEVETTPTPVPTEIVPSETATAIPTDVPPAPSSTADNPPAQNASPVATSVTLPNALACDPPAEATILPGGTYDLACTYTVNDPEAPISVSASFAVMPASGWLVSIDPAAEAETARGTEPSVSWSPGTILAVGAAIDLVVRIVAPGDAAAGQIASLTVSSLGGSTQPAQLDLVVGDAKFTPANVTTTDAIQCSSYNSPRPLGWNSAITYRCLWDTGLDAVPGRVTAGAVLNQTAFNAGWRYGFATFRSQEVPTARTSGAQFSQFFLDQAGNAFPIAFYLTLWTPSSPASVTSASGTFSFSCDGCPVSTETNTVTIEATIGESSSQDGDASLTCVPAAGGASVSVSYASPAELGCTLEALVDDLTLLYPSVGAPPGWNVTIHGGSGGLPASLAKGATYTFGISLSPGECGLTAASVPILVAANVQRGGDAEKAVSFEIPLTVAPSDVLRPASASFDSAPFNFGSGSWNQPAGGSIYSTITIRPPSCLPTGTTQQVSLSIAGNGSAFRSTSGGTLALSQLTLWSVQGSFPDMTALPITPGTAVTTAPQIVSITAAGDTARRFGTVIALLAPAGTPPGTYTATITLDITGGSD